MGYHSLAHPPFGADILHQLPVAIGFTLDLLSRAAKKHLRSPHPWDHGPVLSIVEAKSPVKISYSCLSVKSWAKSSSCSLIILGSSRRRLRGSKPGSDPPARLFLFYVHLYPATLSMTLVCSSHSMSISRSWASGNTNYRKWKEYLLNCGSEGGT